MPSLVLAWVVWRLPEPARGGGSQIAAGATEIRGERGARTPAGRDDEAGGGPGPDGQEQGLAERALADAGVRPRADLVLREDPTRRPVWWALRYVLRVRTNVVIIIASALGYFYFAGLRSFAVLFATGHYGISKPTATFLIVVIGVGALAGVYAGGRFSDRRLRRGHLRVRVVFPAVCLLALVPVLAAGIVARSVVIALPLLLVGARTVAELAPALIRRRPPLSAGSVPETRQRAL